MLTRNISPVSWLLKVLPGLYEIKALRNTDPAAGRCGTGTVKKKTEAPQAASVIAIRIFFSKKRI